MDHDQDPHPSMTHSSGSEHPVSQSEYTYAITPATMDSHSHRHDDDASDTEQGSGSPHSRSTAERRLFNPQENHFATDPNADLERGPRAVSPPSMARLNGDPRDVHVSESPRQRTSGPMNSRQHNPYLDDVVPTNTGNGHGGHKPSFEQSWAGPDGIERGNSQPRDLDEKKDDRNKGALATFVAPLLVLLTACCFTRDSDKKFKPAQWDYGTVGARIVATIRYAELEREKCARRAQRLSYALNIAIGLQVLLGALTTALSAAITSAKQESGLSTIVASYLARVRGSGEPELSIMRVKDLEHFIRDCRGFEHDHGREEASYHHHCPVNKRLLELRQKLEDLLNNASGERKLSATGVAPTETTSTGAAQTRTGNRTV